MEIKINEVIRNRRRSLNISQEDLAERLGITVQAVSKWETGVSYPDITMLPKIAEVFEISLDQLFFGGEENIYFTLNGIPDDNKLRVVQCIGSRVLDSKEAAVKDRLMLVLPKDSEKNLSFEIWGSADINGDVGGNICAGAGVNCGRVGGYVYAGAGVNCSSVGGYVDAGGGVNCSSVGGYVDAGGGINCGDVGRGANAGGDIYCGNVSGDVEAGHDVSCSEIKGNVNCAGNVTFKNK